MSDKKDTGTDRRTLIAAAAAAAAGVAAASSASALNPQPEPPGRRAPTQIRVDLGGVRLSEAQAQALEKQISSDVLAAIGRAGVKGNPRIGGLGPGIYGIIYRPTFIPPIATGRPG